MNPVVAAVQAEVPSDLDAMRRASAMPWLLVAVAPVFFALVTWSTTFPPRPALAAIRLFGLPLVAVELAVICFAILRDFKPLDVLLSLSDRSKLLLLVLVVDAFAMAWFAPGDRIAALMWTFITFVHLLFGICVLALARGAGARAVSAIWQGVVGGLAAFALIWILFVYVALRSPHEDWRYWQYFGLGMSNIRQVGYYSAVGCAAALGLAVHARGKPVSTLITAAALALAISFASGTRGSVVAIWIAFGAGAAVLPALRTLRAWAMLLMATVSAAGISLLLPVPDTLYGIQRIVASAGQTTLNQMSSGRLDMWRSAWRAFLHRPLFGYGEGQMAWVAPNAQDVYFQPHNIVLQLLLQWGLLGTALFGALAIPVARSCWRVAGANPAAAAPAYLVAASLLVLSLYDGAFFHVYPVMMLAFAFAMMIAAGGRSVTRAQP